MNEPALNDDRQWREVAARFRFAGKCVLVLGICGWLCWFLPFDDLLDRSQTPLGGDYVMLYVAGRTVLAGETSTLYDDHCNQQRSAALFPTMAPTASWPYRYPPTVATCMAPLAALPFGPSFACFAVVQIALLGLSVWLLREGSQPLQNNQAWMWAMIGAPAVLETMIGGQSSLLALTCVSAFLFFLDRKQDVPAGIALALALYKPNVLAVLVVGCLLKRPQLLKGFMPTAIAGVAVALLTTGATGFAEYLSLGSTLATSRWTLETPLHKVHGLAPLFQTWTPAHGKLVALGCGLLLAGTIAWLWRGKRLQSNTALCLLLLANTLFNPYVPIYDLVLLIPAVVLFDRAVRAHELPRVRPAQAQLGLLMLFVGPHLSQAMAQVWGIQLFPILLTLLIGWYVLFQQRSRFRLAAMT